MAGTEYESKLITTSIRFTSRVSIKIKDNYFTVEACEERTIPEDITNINEINWTKEKRLLWNAVNDECDDQIQEIKDLFAQ